MSAFATSCPKPDFQESTPHFALPCRSLISRNRTWQLYWFCDRKGTVRTRPNYSHFVTIFAILKPDVLRVEVPTASRPIPVINDRFGYDEKLTIAWSNNSPASSARLSRLRFSEVDRAIDKIGYVICCLDRQRMLGESRPRRYVIRHLARHLELPVRTFSQDCEN